MPHERAGVVSGVTLEVLKRIKGCRNILVHEHARVADEIICDAVTAKLGDCEAFRREVLQALEAM